MERPSDVKRRLLDEATENALWDRRVPRGVERFVSVDPRSRPLDGWPASTRARGLASSLEGTPNALLYHAADPAADATTRRRARDVASAQGGGAAGKEC
eukprot:31131-Pelagococcus_subviridis.AAC.6